MTKISLVVRKHYDFRLNGILRIRNQKLQKGLENGKQQSEGVTTRIRILYPYICPANNVQNLK